MRRRGAEAADASAVRLIAPPVAPLVAEPRAAAEQVSQAVAGEEAAILEAREGWRRVRLHDGYEGWMHEGYLERSERTPAELDDFRATARYSLGCSITDPLTDLPRALPLGARVAKDARIIDGALLNAGELKRRYPPHGTEIAASAGRWFGSTSYQWGGITPWGADCSGMVQTVFAMHGVSLPRDARQQAEIGSPLGLTPAEWRRGDLLFFSDREDGRITHVAIVADAETLLHVAIGRGGFSVEHLRDARDGYTTALMTRLRSARRII